MPIPDSVVLRRQIGFIKRQLQRYCSAIVDILKEYRIEPSEPVLSHLNNEDLESFRFELASTKANLLKAYNKTVKLHDDWTKLRDSNPLEQKVFEDYVAKYGDYRADITLAVNNLEQLDAILNILDAEYVKRELHPPSESDSTLVDDDDSYSQTLRHQRRRFTQTTASVLDPSLLNFVDASILTKLDLPTFDGNLLDYPEFSARFATLVANKIQLDDTTKFSLLKSCLRGKALQFIEGLSMTAENYGIAMDILKTLYDDQVTVRHILFTKLAQLPSCDPEGRHLPTLYNQMFSLVRQFSNNHNDSNETALGAILLNKLPLRVRSLVYDRTSNDHNVSPSELLHLLTDIVRKDSTLFEMEYHARPSVNTRTSSHSFHVACNRTSRPSQPREFKKRRKCSYCNSVIHLTIECDVFSTPKQRIEQVKLRKLCFNCLSSSHATRECPSKLCCTFCSKRHHSSICFHSNFSRKPPANPQVANSGNSMAPTRSQRSMKSSQRLQNHAVHVEESTKEASVLPNTEKPLVATQTDVSTNQEPVICSTEHAITSSQAALMCATVTLFNPNEPFCRTTVTAFLDSGSSKSYITEELASSLQLATTGTENITLSTFGTSKSLELPCRNHTIGLCTETGSKQLQVKSLPMLTGNLQRVVLPQNEEVNDVIITNCKPSILIGNDYFWDIILSEEFHFKAISKDYRILHTTIGNIIVGRAFKTKKHKACAAVQAPACDSDSSNPSRHEELVELVNNFWKLETVGIMDNPDQKEDEECLRYFNNTVHYDETQKRYIVKLPFKMNPTQLPNNFSLAFSRLCAQHQSLQENESYLRQYHAIFEDQLQRKVIERVPTNTPCNLCHYLSHHGVVKQDGGNVKIRCVFDGSAKLKGHLSLNDILHRGLVLLPDLTGILLRSRLHKILISSDIEKAFLMVGLNEDCRDFTRFLWLKDPLRPSQLPKMSEEHQKWKTMLIDVTRFSTWTKLITTFKIVLKFLTFKFPQTNSLFGSTDVALLQKAETILFRSAQLVSPPNDEHKKHLNLFLCTRTSLWKSHGRIEYADLPL
ncbi:unnamed protein product [Cylicocyclus nassatus]|uniref:DUF1758 domain-containing protein n=1 Tax=Cylicocyclus nassatus TaxID=53992 RepID=A0AA36GRX6_CYLNA|nr:unnamed protein product [Cylicocyclus nassatus]